MPGVSRSQRAEAKYNVTLDFPHLGLHSAAATGNLGLVKYALDHGQPINSVLDGVLPLHAACSGGNDIVVRLLIENGADVNAPRLPRRYSNDKKRDASAPIVGSSGSTPLHFACANGHTTVVRTLLLHGARPDRADKHGVTPEMLARQKGWLTCADVLKEWCDNKDKDLRDREGLGSSQNIKGNAPEPSAPKEKEHGYCGSLDCQTCSTRKRLRVKRSIDNALHMFKPSSLHCTAPVTNSPGPPLRPPSPPGKPLGEYTFYPTPDSSTVEETPARRPSLPQVLELPHGTPPSIRRPSFASGTSSRRPRSAGTGAEPSSTPQHKIRGKISLLSIFKKANSDAYGTPESLSGYNSSNSAFTSASASPGPEPYLHYAASNLSSDVLASIPPDSSPLSARGALPVRSRVMSESGDHSPIPQAVELHHALSRDSLGAQGGLGMNDNLGTKSSSFRQGILRAHGRSTSAGQTPPSTETMRLAASTQQPSLRALRFDSSSTTSSRGSEIRDRRHESRSPTRNLTGSASFHSLRSRSPGSTWGMHRDGRDLPQVYSPKQIASEAGHDQDIEEEEEYGQPVEPHVGIADLSSLTISETGERGGSLGSLGASSPSGPSPVGPVTHVFECPFSINDPLPDDPGHTPHPNMLGITPVDSRTRGDSLSSTSTNASANAASSSDTSAYVVTPALSTTNLPTPGISSPNSAPYDLPLPMEVLAAQEKGYVLLSPSEDTSTPLARRPRAPLDIDIRSISSHAQAEALVQRAQQRILDMQHDVDDEDGALRLKMGEGHTPLSARLAAYGESLAIERKFKEEEEKRRSPVVTREPVPPLPPSMTAEVEAQGILKGSQSLRALDRKFSLEEHKHPRGGIVKARKMKRPHTSGGTPISALANDPHPTERFPGHQHSVSSDPVLMSIHQSSGKPSRLHAASITPPQSSFLQVRSESVPKPRSSLTRSRTPDPALETDDMLYAGGGAPLSRYPTAPAPAQDCLNDVADFNKSLGQRERQVARANKLAKMGLSGGESLQNSVGYSRSNQKPKFGGIRTFVQSLKGR